MNKALSLLSLAALSVIPAHSQDNTRFKRVLLISVDGMHAVDYLNCSRGLSTINNGEPYCPAIAALGKTSISYADASTSKPSDSFPGLMSIITGGTPRHIGIYYDVAYDRSLDAPAKTTGNGVAAGPCTPNAKPTGTTTEYEEGIDKNQALVNGGAPGAGLTEGGIASIDPARLPRDPARNCAPVYPWDFVRTNTIFGVIHQSGGYTAWSDKHPAYASVAGRGSNGATLNDFYAPEINSNVVALPGITTPTGISCSTVRDPSQVGAWTDSFQNVQCYDTLKVNAILNQIDGKTHDGKAAQVPQIFGMNFQALSVGQKLIEKGFGDGGYTDSIGTPTANLLGEIRFVDASIAEFVAELKDKGLFDSTLIIITAKHGQSPIDPQRYLPIPGPNGNNGTSPANLVATLLPYSESPLNPTGIGPTEDDVSLLWLKDGSDTASAVDTLEANAAKAGIGEIFSGPALELVYNRPGLPPTGDPRTPDIIVTPHIGVTYTGSSKKLMEHGGFNHDDTNVVLLLSNPAFTKRVVHAAVGTNQIGPTILWELGLDPSRLDAVRAEGTEILPNLQ